MLYRIVKMTFRMECIPDFIMIFENAQAIILGFDGCQVVQALQDVDDPRVFFTYSIWNNESALNAYRNSKEFSEIWTKTKALFADKPMAWSLQSLS